MYTLVYRDKDKALKTIEGKTLGQIEDTLMELQTFGSYPCWEWTEDGWERFDEALGDNTTIIQGLTAEDIVAYANWSFASDPGREFIGLFNEFESMTSDFKHIDLYPSVDDAFRGEVLPWIHGTFKPSPENIDMFDRVFVAIRGKVALIATLDYFYLWIGELTA